MFKKLENGLDVFEFNGSLYVNVDKRGSMVNAPNWVKGRGWKVECPNENSDVLVVWNRRLDRPRKIELKKTQWSTSRSGKA